MGLIFSILLFLLSIIFFKVFSIYIGLTTLILALCLLIGSLRIFQKIDIKSSFISEGIIYVKDYQGPYKNIGKEIYKILDKLEKLGLEKEYKIFCIDYDNPLDTKTDRTNCKASVGIYKQKSDKFEIDESIEKYAKEQKMVSKMIPKTRTLQAEWKYHNILAMVVGIKRFYKTLHEKLSEPKFCETMKARKEDIKIAVEIYQPNVKISFNIPFENQDEFMLFSKAK